MSTTALNSNNSSTTTIHSQQDTILMQEQQQQIQLKYRQWLIDSFIVILVILPIICCEMGFIEPFRRGFFCNDESIHYPHQTPIISNTVLILIIILLPLMLFFLIEIIRQRQYYLIPFKLYMYYIFGLALTLNTIELAKFSLGRLRPHFLAICQPRMYDGSNCQDAQNQQRYIERYFCDGVENLHAQYTQSELREARVSFPSGHAGLIWYSMLYSALYLQLRLPASGITCLARHLLQFLCFALAWFVSLSRVMDNWHHWSDVLAGALLGILGAILTTQFISKINSNKYMKKQKQQQQQQHNNITTIPYNLSTISAVVESQYCTKV